jgi:erythromycin esterase
MRDTIIFFIIFLFIIPAKAQDLFFSEEVLKAAIPANSISFRDAGKDLEQLKAAIGNKKIVFLGEHYHQEGSTFKAKSRIVRYLHENMGFNVIAHESSLSENYRMQKEGRGKEDFLVYKQADEMLEISTDEYTLLSYIYYQTRPTRNKLEYVGIDINVGATPFGFVNFLKKELEYFQPSVTKTAEWEAYEQYLIKIYKAEPEKRNSNFPAQTAQYISLVESNKEQSKRKDYLLQILKNLIGLNDFVQNKPPEPIGDTNKITWEEFCYYKLRDKQMGDNLLWVIENALKSGKKVIVWASSYHTSRNLHLLEQNHAHCSAMPMGQYVWDKYGDEVYSIAFTGYSGKAGNIAQNPYHFGKNEIKKVDVTNEAGEKVGEVKIRHLKVDSLSVTPLAPKPPNTVEAILHEKYKFAFLDLKPFKDAQFTLFPAFDKPYTVKWAEIYDGIYFINKIEPFTRKPLDTYFGGENLFENLFWFWPGKLVD